MKILYQGIGGRALLLPSTGATSHYNLKIALELDFLTSDFGTMVLRRYRRQPYSRSSVLLFLLLSLLSLHSASSSSFEPYQLNGGLVAAVAGSDFCVVASDTRLMDGGYEIYTRRHLTSRLWGVNGDNDEWLEPDGSLRLPSSEKSSDREGTETSIVRPPVFVASAGCSADCEALKRLVRLEARASHYWNTDLQVANIASLVSQVLYQRRGFPYYAFCVVAGLSNSGNRGGATFVYDAIGSFEQVAVATAGTGRELLQPTLDRLFSSRRTENEDASSTSSTGSTLTTMPPVVQTQVDCSVDETVSRLVRGYRSVSERDIGVGDSVVLCIIQRKDDDCMCRVLSVPLKQH